MVITSSTLSAFFQNLETVFNNAYTTAAPRWPELAMKVVSDTKSNVYGMIKQIPGYREWLGARVVHNIVESGYELTNKPWEQTLGIDIFDLEDDQMGLYTPLTQMMAKSAAEHPDVQVYNLLKAGFSSTTLVNGIGGACIDGQAFFSADHPWTTDKDGVAVTFTNSSNLALSDANFSTVRAALLNNLQSGDSPFMAAEPELVLVVGRALETTARQIVDAEYDALGQTNVLKGQAKLHVSGQLSGAYANYWYILVTNNPLMPLIYQHRMDPDITYPTYSDYETKKTKEALFMGTYRAAYGYGLPILAYGSTGA